MVFSTQKQLLNTNKTNAIEALVKMIYRRTWKVTSKYCSIKETMQDFWWLANTPRGSANSCGHHGYQLVTTGAFSSLTIIWNVSTVKVRKGSLIRGYWQNEAWLHVPPRAQEQEQALCNSGMTLSQRNPKYVIGYPYWRLGYTTDHQKVFTVIYTSIFSSIVITWLSYMNPSPLLHWSLVTESQVL